MRTHQELPEVFGRYRILRKLGAGGMGAVYLAEDTKLRRQVALKVPHFTSDTRGPVLERFRREARLAAGIDHPNLCAVYDVDEIDGIHFFTMEFVEGTLLSDQIVDGRPWPERSAVGLVRRVALAVGELHRRGIVHRDLKPANVMVRTSGEPVLMDFGLACALASESQRLTGTGEVLGTLAYMPLEQLEGDRQRLGPASDVYSLGMILYELLTGQLPFDGPPLAVVHQVGHKVPEPPSRLRPTVAARLDAICLAALAKRPEDRFPDTAAFVAALDEFLQTPGGQRLDCPQCGKALKVPAARKGKRLKCPRCGAGLAPTTMTQPLKEVVSFPETLGEAELAPTMLTQPRPGPAFSRHETLRNSSRETTARRGPATAPVVPRESTSRGPFLLVALMVGLLVLLVAGVVVFRSRQHDGRPEPRGSGEDASGKVEGRETPLPPVVQGPVAPAAGGEHEAVRKEMIGLMNEYADILDKAKDKASAEKAKTELEALADKSKSVGEKAKKLGEPKDEALMKKMQPEMEKAQKRITEASQALAKKSEVAAFLAKPMADLAKRLGEAMAPKEAADRPLPPPASLRLLPFPPLSVEAGKSARVPVKIKREHCPGRVWVELAEVSAGVEYLKGVVEEGSEEGSLEVAVDADAAPGTRTLRLWAVAGAARTEGELSLTVQAGGPRPMASSRSGKTVGTPKGDQSKRQAGESQAIQPGSRPANSGHVVQYCCPKKCTKSDLHPDYATRIEQNLDFFGVPLRRIDFRRPDGWWRTTIVYGPSPDWQERTFSSKEAARAALHELRTSGFQVKPLKE
jgi:hypothetical protein